MDVDSLPDNQPDAGDADAVIEQLTTRPYQEQLIELAMRRNTIIFLPTGSGKTYIALQIIKRMSKALEKPIDDGGKISLIVTKTVVLAKQHAQWIRGQTPLRISCLTGDLNTDDWSADRWHDELNAHQVIVATCQTMVNAVQHQYLTIGQLNVIVFDECHNATGKDPMVQLMDFYRRHVATSFGDRPHIIGLSGTLLGQNVRASTILLEMQRLEQQFGANITTVTSTDDFVNLLVYSTKPVESIVSFAPNASDSALRAAIRQRVDEFMRSAVDIWPIAANPNAVKDAHRSGKIKLTKTVRSLFVDFLHQLDDLGVYGGSLSILSVIVELELEKRRSDEKLKRLLCRLTLTFAERIRHQLVAGWAAQLEPVRRVPKAKTAFSEADDDLIDRSPTPLDSAQTIRDRSSDKVRTLLRFLADHLAGARAKSADYQPKCLVFVQRRQSAKVLFHVLRNYALAEPDSFGYRPDFMVGSVSALSASLQQHLENHWNRDVLKRFERNETNLIVATNVLEEGVDLQSCNLVVSFDTPRTYSSYVQSKGRARHADSVYAVLVDQSRRPETLRELAESQQIEQLLRNYLVGKSLGRRPPEQRCWLSDHPERPLRSKSGAEVHVAGAMALLNRYCMSLARDAFAPPTLRWSTLSPDDATSGFRVRLQLPVQSPIKETIDSGAESTLVAAKRSAAFRACRLLYERGLLDEQLLPLNAGRIERQIADAYLQHWRSGELQADARRVERARRSGGRVQRVHAVRWPRALAGGCMPQPGRPAFLYTIDLEPTERWGAPAVCGGADEERRLRRMDAFRQRYASAERGYALLSATRLAPCAAFTVETAVGQMRVRIAADGVVETEPLPDGPDGALRCEQMRRFTQFVFRDVLNIGHSFLANDSGDREQSFAVVAVRERTHIDWPVVAGFQQPWRLHDGDAAVADPVGDLERRKRARRTLQRDDYEDRVVYPWYRLDWDKRYVVVAVREHLTPFSPFPNGAFESYAAYIEEKYQLRVADPQQFMLQVEAIADGGLNALLRPDAKTVFAVRGDQEMLIPELCQNLDFPGVLWLKAIVLPTIVHRMQHLLGADELRAELNEYLHVDDGAYRPAELPAPRYDRADAEKLAAKEAVPVRAIVIPNPEEAPVRQLRRDEFVSIGQASVNRPWQRNAEPNDCLRNLGEIYAFEVDYLYSFVSERMGALSLNEPKPSKATAASNASAAAGARIGALCDRSAAERAELRILEAHRSAGPIEQTALLTALACPSAEDQFDHRRQAIAGDAIVRFAVTLHLLRAHADAHNIAWLLTALERLAGAQNLDYCGIARQLPGRMKSVPFAPLDDWAPPLLAVPATARSAIERLNGCPESLYALRLSDAERWTGEASDETLIAFIDRLMQQTERTDSADPDADVPYDDIGDTMAATFLGKQRIAAGCVANALRAIVAECGRALGLPGALRAIAYFGVLDASATDALLRLDGPLIGGTLPGVRLADAGRVIDALLINAPALEQAIGYRFGNRAYMLQALTHASFGDNAVTDCNERLALLGRSLCDFLLTAYVCERGAGHLGADELANLRHALVANIALAAYSVRLGVHRYMLSASQALCERIAAFVAFQEQHEHRLNDQVLLLIEEDDVRMGEFVDVPAAIGDAFAALMAAVHLDGGGDLQATWTVLRPLVEDDVTRLLWNVPRDPIGRLDDWPGAKPLYEPAERLPGDGGADDLCMVGVRFTRRDEVVQTYGFGRTAKQAKMAAAKVALHALQQ